MSKTKYQLAEKGMHLGYFEIWKPDTGPNKDLYTAFIMMSNTGQTIPICKSKKDLDLVTLFNTKLNWYTAENEPCGTLKEYLSSEYAKERYCSTQKDFRHWNKLQKVLATTK